MMRSLRDTHTTQAPIGRHMDQQLLQGAESLADLSAKEALVADAGDDKTETVAKLYLAAGAPVREIRRGLPCV